MAATPDHAADDGDPQRSAFSIGQAVRVLARGGRNTPRVGVVDEVIWHHKDGRWNYYLRVNGKKISKRYVAEDLEATEVARNSRP